MDVSRLLEDRAHRAQPPAIHPECSTPAQQNELRWRVEDALFRPVFAFVGSTVITSILVVLFMELGASAVLAAYHWVRPDTQDNFADSSPGIRRILVGSGVLERRKVAMEDSARKLRTFSCLGSSALAQRIPQCGRH
jgi:hypothetical protein